MKTFSLIAAALALMVANAAMAEEVEIGGEAEPMCTLPANWSFVSAGGGASGAQFSGVTWTIPGAAFADATGGAVTGSEYAIRIRGTGSCNASHSITVTSLRGGLVSEAAAAPPAGFANRRPMKYDAYWSQNGVSSPYGPSLSYTPTTPGQSSSRNFTVSGSLAPPGNRTFDIRLGLQRGAVAQPLVAGDYSDVITVTLALAP